MSVTFEELHEIAVVVARKVHRRYHTYFDMQDVVQELSVWILRRQDKIAEWLDHEVGTDEYKMGVKKLGKTLTRHADKYCRRIKAQKLGYEIRDEQYYDSATIEDLLPYALNEDVQTTSPGESEKVSNLGNPAEGGNYVIQLFDIRRALMHASEEDRKVLRLRFFDQLSYKDIADLLAVSDTTANRKVDGAVRRISEALGGPNPFGKDEE
jgi:RNA polymerase sigma factor (sigma-70 family)